MIGDGSVGGGRRWSLLPVNGTECGRCLRPTILVPHREERRMPSPHKGGPPSRLERRRRQAPHPPWSSHLCGSPGEPERLKPPCGVPKENKRLGPQQVRVRLAPGAQDGYRVDATQQLGLEREVCLLLHQGWVGWTGGRGVEGGEGGALILLPRTATRRRREQAATRLRLGGGQQWAGEHGPQHSTLPCGAGPLHHHAGHGTDGDSSRVSTPVSCT